MSAATSKGSRPSRRTAAWAGVVTAWCSDSERSVGRRQPARDRHRAEGDRLVGAVGEQLGDQRQLRRRPAPRCDPDQLAPQPPRRGPQRSVR